MKTINFIAVAIIVLFLFGMGFWTGRVTKQCSPSGIDTVYVRDTTWNTIRDTILYSIVTRDTIYIAQEVPADVDTAAILKDHYSIYLYQWEKQDTNLKFMLLTTITQNVPIGYQFGYEILRPQTVVVNTIDNTITYNRYVYGGISLPIYPFNVLEATSLDVTYAGPKGYLGVGWQPGINIAALSIKAGSNLLKFTSKK